MVLGGMVDTWRRESLNRHLFDSPAAPPSSGLVVVGDHSSPGYSAFDDVVLAASEQSHILVYSPGP
jgi:hypothetical protein